MSMLSASVSASANASANLATSTSPGSSSPIPITSIFPLLSVSVIDLLEADPRPTFVIALVSPTATEAVNTNNGDSNGSTNGSSNGRGNGNGNRITNAPLSSSSSSGPDSPAILSGFLPHVIYGNPALTSSPLLRNIVSATSQAHYAAIWADITTAYTATTHRVVLPAVDHLGVHWTRSVINGGRFVVISANMPLVTEAVPRLAEPAEPYPIAAAAAAAAATAAATAAELTPDAKQEPERLHGHQSSHLRSPLSPPTPPTSALFSPSEQDTSIMHEILSTTPKQHTPTHLLDEKAAEMDTSDPDGSGNSQYRNGGDSKYIRQFRAIADYVPFGLVIFDADGIVNFANQAWYRIIGIPPQLEAQFIYQSDILQYVEEEDHPVILRSYEQVVNVPSITFGFRVKRRKKDREEAHAFVAGYAPPNNSPSSYGTPDQADTAGPDSFGSAVKESTHVLATATAEKDADGRMMRVIVCLRDMTEEHRNIAAAVDLYAQQANNLRRMTEYATVGLYDMDTDGRLRGANRVFYEMCGLEANEGSDLTKRIVKPWLQCVNDQDLEVVSSALTRLATNGVYQSVEVRLKKPWTSDDGAGNRIDAPRWIDVTMLPVKDAEGNVFSITGCVCDVSLRKWQLERERQVKEEAIESRRQQENFVDVTSHEIRNPLTVIMHCGDAVLESLTRIRDLAAHVREPTSVSALTEPAAALSETESAIDDAIDYTEIIVGSALHQKSIVDDILTMSKLDSDLLTVTPVTIDPIDIVHNTLRMFEVQARQQSIALNMVVAPSFKSLGVRYLDLDPSRLKQILINLLTNALKFTRSSDVRQVTVSVAASFSRPTDEVCSVSFVPRTEVKTTEPSGVASKPQGVSVFLIFEVRDTGEGLTKEGRDTLFQKFVQVDSMTHVKHGGSGLGLFISKRLVEIQNGAIGVASKPGEGSVFAFYIETHISPQGVVPDILSPAAAAKQALAAGFGAPPGKGSEALADIAGNAIAAEISIPGSECTSGRATPTPMLRREHTWDSNSGGSRGGLACVPESPPEVRGVLLVEDNVVNQKVTRRYFEKCGFSVQVAANGVEAMKRIEESDRCVPGSFPISVVLMDMEMPVQGGVECTQNIRALEAAGKFAGGRIPVLMITGNARPEQIADARAAGCDDVIIKPFHMNLLYEHIQLVMRMLWEEDRRLLSPEKDDEAAKVVSAAAVSPMAEGSVVVEQQAS